jgi:hypothetical protein
MYAATLRGQAGNHNIHITKEGNKSRGSRRPRDVLGPD